MSGPGLNSLATIIKRLEATTSRLEDLAVAQASGTLFRRDDFQPDKNSNINLPPTPTVIPPPPPPPPPAPAPLMVEIPESVTAFDDVIVERKLKPFIDLTKSFAGPLVVEQVGYLEDAFKSLRSIILATGSCKKPDAAAIQSLFDPLRKNVMSILHVPEANRKERQWYTHLQVIAEGAPSLGWVEIERKPGPHIASMKEASEFYGNKIIKEFKEKDPKQVEWTRAWLSLLEEQRKYVIQFFTTGLTWNPKGVALAQFLTSSPDTSSGAGIPPPPPPPPPTAAPSAPAAGGVAAVFAELNRGEEVTKGLRKVDKSEMTHKNPALRASNIVPSDPGSGANHSQTSRPTKPSKPAALSRKKPTKFSLEGNKWLIEYYENESGLVVGETEMSQTVNLYGCKNTTVQIKGKVNAVTLVNCTKTSILVESVIASISITSSPSFALQITGSAPTIQIDSTDSGQIYLSKECLGVEITTAKCMSINVSLPVVGEDEGVFVEKAIPEMLRTTIQGGKLVTTIVEHSG